MYIKEEIIVKAFSQLKGLAESHSGKKAREGLSGLRYFLATAELLKKKQADSVNIAPAEKTNRALFVEAVGNVVRLDEDWGYSNNFYNEFERDKGYSVSRNFLTTRLKEDGPTPSRPAPLMEVVKETVSLHDDYAAQLKNYGAWDSYKAALALWLVRFESFPDADKDNADKISARVLTLLRERYGDKVAAVLVGKAEEISSQFKDFAKPFLQEKIPDYFSLLEKQTVSVGVANSDVGDNVIYYGAPGTGKSYQLKKYSPSIRTVFHGDYQNSDFVGSYRPFVKGDDVIYTFMPGPFIKAFVNALKTPKNHQYLIIEEINRAPAASVFGEIFQLLDRDATGQSEYQISVDEALGKYLETELKGNALWKGDLYLPKNLSILATMNSADQGVEPIDTAFKRRWKFIYLPINFTKISSSDDRRKKLISYAGVSYDWCEFAEAINAMLIQEGLDEDRLLGPYFVSGSDFAEPTKFNDIISGKVFIYLWDDVLRHGLRHTIFHENYKTYNELTADFLKGKRVLSKAVEHKLGYTPPPEED